MIGGPLDTDTRALACRIDTHDRFGSVDIDPWIVAHVASEPGHHVLDLGCGTGKQSLLLADAVGAEGQVVGIDLSAESLAILGRKARDLGLHERVRTVVASMDGLAEAIPGQRFQRVVGCFSLYYAQDPKTLFETVRAALDPGGVLFFCGPGHDNNGELLRFHHRLRDEPLPETSPAARFMEVEGSTFTAELFRSVDVARFENPLRFTSPVALYDYWRSYGLYDAERDADFRQAASRHFETSDVFETVKRVIGVRGVA